MKKLVSVVIPTYNRESSIVRAVESALNQTYENIEVIVVDDCSKDSTPSVMKEHFENDNRVIYYIQEKNAGACAARNKGVQLSHGDYVAFLDSDDYYLPSKIELQVRALEESGCELCATNYERQQKDGQKEIVKTYPGTKEEVYNELLYCNFITTGTLIGNRQCFIDTPFDESLPRYQDWDLVLRLCKKYNYFFLQENTLIQIYQPVSITASTNHEKTLKALETIYSKNYDGYKSNKRALTQVQWLMGLHSLYTSRKQYKLLMKGAIGNGISFRRLIVYACAKMKLLSILNKYI